MLEQKIPRVIAVTVTYGDRWERFGSETVGRAIDAGVDSVIVVHNGNKGELRRRVERDVHRVGVTEMFLEKNTGSANAFGLGMKAAIDQGTDYIWLLDDDNWVASDSLSRMLAVARNSVPVCDGASRQVLAAYRPRTRQWHALGEGKPCAQYAVPPSAFLGLGVGAMLRAKCLGMLFGLLGVWVRERQVSACYTIPGWGGTAYGGLLVPRGVIEEIGYPLRELVLYHDDGEWTERMTQMGIQLKLVPSAMIEDVDYTWGDTGNSIRRLCSSGSQGKIHYFVRNLAYIESIRPRRGWSSLLRVVNSFAWFALARHYCRRDRSGQTWTTIVNAYRQGSRGDLSSNPELTI